MRVAYTPTLNANATGGLNRAGIVSAGFVGKQGAKSGFVAFREEVAPTLRQGQTSECVIDAAGFIDAVGANAQGGIGYTPCGSPALRAGDVRSVCYSQMGKPRKYIIRRLTPLECCRLQGFPDWWENGVCGSDAARYKMWGNGIALPCAVDVLSRIANNGKE